MRKILWISDSPLWEHVGQSRVTREVCKRLAKDYEVVVGGFYTDHEKFVGQVSNHSDGYMVHNLVRSNSNLIIDLIHKTRPDIVIMSHDCWEFPNVPLFARKFPDIKFIGWFTIDGEPIDRKWRGILEHCSLIMSPTEYGKKVINDQYMHLDVEVVPYGIDHNVFCKPDHGEKEIVREKSGLGDLTGKFVAQYVGQNQTRKNLGASMDGWAQFAKGKDDVFFAVVTHTRRVDHGEWQNVPIDYDLSNWPTTTVGVVDTMVHNVSDDVLALFYKMGDVFLLPSLGESPGLPLLEAMASGVVPITTNYSGQTDFCKDGQTAFMMEGVDFWPQMWSVKRKVVDPTVVAATLEMAYDIWKNDKPRFHRLSQGAIAEVRKYDWETTANKVKKCVERLFDETRTGRLNRVVRV